MEWGQESWARGRQSNRYPPEGWRFTQPHVSPPQNRGFFIYTAASSEYSTRLGEHKGSTLPSLPLWVQEGSAPKLGPLPTSQSSLFPLMHPGPGTPKPSSQVWPWGAFLGHESVTTAPHEVGTAPSLAQSILVGSFLCSLVSRTILARDRRIGTAMGRKRGM